MLPDFAENKLKIIGIVAATLLLADLALVNFRIFSSSRAPLSPIALPTPSIEAPKISPAASGPETTCPAACLAAISVANKETKAPTAQPAQPTAVGLAAKEIYIPLGNGSTKSQEWAEIPGAEAVLDMANFPKIKSVIFEAFLQIPTGNGKAYAKLYNVSDKHDVWLSEVVIEGGGIQRMESKNISLDAGRKLYRVMMKTSMGYEAVLESARLKIILE